MSSNDWMMPNRKGFLDWVYKKFPPSKYETHSRFLPHQRFVKDLLSYDGPYRGLLLFHQLGTGKTASSIAAAEGFVTRGKTVIVMLPASLQNNFKGEILKHASIGNPHKKRWTTVDVTDRALAMDLGIDPASAFYKRLGDAAKQLPFPVSMTDDRDNENSSSSANPQSWKKLSELEQHLATDLINYFIESKYVFVNYDGMRANTKSSKAFNEAIKQPDALVIIDEAHNFISRVANNRDIAKSVYIKLMEAASTKIVMLTGTPIRNNPFELCLALNLLRGPIPVIVYSLTKTKGRMPMDESDVREIIQDDLIDEVILDRTTNQIKIVPSNLGADFSEVNEEMRRTFGTSKKIDFDFMYALPTSEEEFRNTFLDTTIPNHPRVKNMDVFMRRIIGIVSYVKTIGDEYFPHVNPRKIVQVPMSKHQFTKYFTLRKMERAKERRRPGAGGEEQSVYRAFSRMACNFVFPDDIKRKYPFELLRHIATSEIDVVDGELPDIDDPKQELLRKKKQYEKTIENALQQLDDRADDYLDYKIAGNNIDRGLMVYSPKMVHIMRDLEASMGKVLLYSQFRTVEGLGIIKLVLKHAGYREVLLETKEGQWKLADEEVLKPEYDNKRYITFSADKEKTKALLQLFNVGKTVPSELKSMARPNLHGEFIKLLLITQSGAEGISLKCVRDVLIMEPFWNMVRLDQVIGRAVRAYSHVELPKNERNVSVSIYTTVFTPEMLEDMTIRTLDNSRTSDAYILELAQAKDTVNQAFLDLLKKAAVDCRVNAKKNKIMPEMQCYAFPLPYDDQDLAYHASLGRDLSDTDQQARLIRKARIQGRVVKSKIDGKKYVVVDEYPGQLFDYDAYRDAGVLMV